MGTSGRGTRRDGRVHGRGQDGALPAREPRRAARGRARAAAAAERAGQVADAIIRELALSSGESSDDETSRGRGAPPARTSPSPGGGAEEGGGGEARCRFNQDPASRRHCRGSVVQRARNGGVCDACAAVRTRWAARLAAEFPKVLPFTPRTPKPNQSANARADPRGAAGTRQVSPHGALLDLLDRAQSLKAAREVPPPPAPRLRPRPPRSVPLPFSRRCVPRRAAHRGARPQALLRRACGSVQAVADRRVGGGDGDAETHAGARAGRTGARAEGARGAEPRGTAPERRRSEGAVAPSPPGASASARAWRRRAASVGGPPGAPDKAADKEPLADEEPLPFGCPPRPAATATRPAPARPAQAPA